MRLLRTTEQLHDAGLTRGKIRWGERERRWRSIIKGVYGEGAEPPTDLDVARATALLTGGIGFGRLAGVLLGLDSVDLAGGPHVLVPAGGSSARRGVRRVLELPQAITAAQVLCTDGPTTLWTLAGCLDDTTWEHALESALRKRHATAADVASMASSKKRQADRVRRVLHARGGLEVPPTESLLESLMVQLARAVPGLPAPERQVEVYTEHGTFVARVDLAWPSLGIFIELDGQHHRGQPVYDASRQTAVTAATGWLVGRFTWHEVTRAPSATRRRLADLLQRALLRPVVA